MKHGIINFDYHAFMHIHIAASMILGARCIFPTTDKGSHFEGGIIVDNYRPHPHIILYLNSLVTLNISVQ